MVNRYFPSRKKDVLPKIHLVKIHIVSNELVLHTSFHYENNFPFFFPLLVEHVIVILNNNFPVTNVIHNLNWFGLFYT